MFSTDSIEQEMMANRELGSRIQALQLELLEELDRRQVATGDGYRSFSQWVAARLDVSLATSRSMVRTMRRTSNRPDLRGALAEGVSFDRVEAISKIADHVGLMERFDIAGVEATAARRVRTDSSDFLSGDDRVLVLQPTLDEGWWKLWGGLDAASGAVVDKVLTEMADNLPYLPDGTRGDRSWRKAIALFDLCITDDPPPAQVTVFMEAAEAAKTNGHTGLVVESGPNLTREALQAILCDATTEVIARAEDGQ